MFDAIYRDSRSRVTELARSLTDEQLESTVAASPAWTGRDVVAHLVGVATDFSTGNLAGAPGPDWTAAHVSERKGRSLDELIAEWDDKAPVIEAALAGPKPRVQSVYDVLTHESDLRETFGLGLPPVADIEAIAFGAGKGVVAAFPGPGALEVHCADSKGDEHVWTGGETEPGAARAVLTIEPYELFRGLISRRSRRQMRAWKWSGNADPALVIEKLPVFGYRDDDQPLPSGPDTV